MPNINKEQIKFLVKLQQIEIESSKIKSILSSVDHRIEALDNSLNDFEKNIEDEEAVISELNQKYRTYESDVQMNLDRIAKSKAKLRSVKTNKEYQSSLKEIEDLEMVNSKIEDEMIEFLDRIDRAENTLTDTKADYSGLVDQTNKERAAIKEEVAQGKRRLVQLDANWDNISQSIDSELLEKFNKTKAKQINGIAIVPVKDAVCWGCNMNIPPQMYNELHRFDHLINCPHCERIIYCDDHNGRSE